MSSKLYKTGLIKVEPNEEIDLKPIALEKESRGVIHGMVEDVGSKICVAKLYKLTLDNEMDYLMSPVAFQYPDDMGQFLFPIVDTNPDTRYIVKVFCLEPHDTVVEPLYGNGDHE